MSPDIRQARTLPCAQTIDLRGIHRGLGQIGGEILLALYARFTRRAP